MKKVKKKYSVPKQELIEISAFIEESIDDLIMLSSTDSYEFDTNYELMDYVRLRLSKAMNNARVAKARIAIELAQMASSK